MSALCQVLLPLLLLASALCVSSSAQGQPHEAGQPAAPQAEDQVGRAELGSASSFDEEERLRAELRPLARSLLEARTGPAYLNVEGFIHKNQGTETSALAWFAIANARFMDKDFPEALRALENAQLKSGVLDDYVTYLRAQIYSELRLPERVCETLTDFAERYPDSIWKADAALAYSNALLSLERPNDAVTALLENRLPGRLDIDLALAKAYLKSGDSSKGAAILRTIFFTSPLSPEADLADVELKTLETSGAQLPPVTFSEKRTRATLLFQGSRWDQAIRDLDDLLITAPAAEKPGIELRLAVALGKSGRRSQAKILLGRIRPLDAEQDAERLYRLLELARSEKEDKEFQQLLNTLRSRHSQSQWLDRSLLSAANMYLLRGDYDSAISHFVELSARFPSGSRASYASWRASWLYARQGRISAAKSGFEQYLKHYSSSPEVPAVLYWRGRIAEDERDLSVARARYNKLSAQFVNHYYAQQARERLRMIGVGARLTTVAAPEGVTQLSGDARRWKPNDSSLASARVRKSRLLEASGLLVSALSELRVEAQKERSNWLDTEIARLYQESGQYHRALWVLRNAEPGYFSRELKSLPEPVWEGLFPRPYWGEISAFSGQNGVDPVLTVALIRQESEFNPAAISGAKAIGLMQLLPSTASAVAPAVGLDSVSTDVLSEPATNIRLGTRHFADLLRQFDGKPEYALAAYNAGASRVREWLGAGKFSDIPEFVEAIPFTETREYVKAIIRNVRIYQSLYDSPPSSSNAGGQ